MTSPAVPLDPEELLEDSTWLRALSRGLVRDHFAADDLAQDAWLAALRAERGAAAAPPEGVARRTWLTAVLRNLAWKEQRAGARRRSREEHGARGETLPSSGELVARADMQRALSAAIVALDEPFRTTILLRYMEELSSAEIARRQHVPEGTVRWRVQRGLALLRERLEARQGASWLHGCALVAGLSRVPETATITAGAATASAGATMSATTVAAGGFALPSALVASLALCGAGTAVSVAWIGTASESGDPIITTTTPATSPVADDTTSEAEDPGDAARATRVRTALAVPSVPEAAPEGASAPTVFERRYVHGDVAEGGDDRAQFQVAVHVARGDLDAPWMEANGDVLRLVVDDANGDGSIAPDEMLAGAFDVVGESGCDIPEDARVEIETRVRELVANGPSTTNELTHLDVRRLEQLAKGKPVIVVGSSNGPLPPGALLGMKRAGAQFFQKVRVESPAPQVDAPPPR